jgi:hypothetical protein
MYKVRFVLGAFESVESFPTYLAALRRWRELESYASSERLYFEGAIL